MKRPNKNEINIWRKIEENEEVKALFEDVLKTTQIHQTPDSRNTSNKIYTKLLNSKYTNQKTIKYFWREKVGRDWVTKQHHKRETA